MIHDIVPLKHTRRGCRENAKLESLVLVPESLEHSNDSKEIRDLNSLREMSPLQSPASLFVQVCCHKSKLSRLCLFFSLFFPSL
mmetsp:Transcript_47874/g.150165  ORF Transcript_47874/g.150165 Transcript_47874/m.150165 type:complete len:84 (+) Transcript_47874:1945-2196(+)